MRGALFIERYLLERDSADRQKQDAAIADWVLAPAERLIRTEYWDRRGAGHESCAKKTDTLDPVFVVPLPMSPFRTIKFRLIALGVALIVLGVLVRLFVMLPAVRDRVHEVVAEAQLSIAAYVAGDIGRSLQRRSDLVGELAGTLPPALLQQPEQLAAWLGERERLNPLFARGLRVLRPDGALLAQSPKAAEHAHLPTTPALSEAGWFSTALASAVVISTPRRDGFEGRPVTVFAASVRDAAGRVLAVLAGESRPDVGGFLEVLQQARLGASGGFLVIFPAGRLFIASDDPMMALQPIPDRDRSPLLERALTGRPGADIVIDAQGIEALAAIAPVPGTDWLVVAHRPTAEVSQPIAELRRLLWHNSFATIIFLLLVMLVFLPRLLRPLTTASRALREMAEGERELAPLPVTRRDEVGDLLLGFNSLVGRLNEKEQALLQTLEQLDELAGTDALTGAWSRHRFHEVVGREIERSRRYLRPLALILLDVDFFKAINDRFGHGTGDEVLQAVAECLRGVLRKPDSLTRWGGEEFLALLPDTDLESALALAERARAAIFAHDFESVGRVSASFGVAELGETESRDEWIARADAALYRAKKAGRNLVEADRTAVGRAAAHGGLIQIVWHPAFESGNPQLDTEHQGLFDEINALLWVLIVAERPLEELRVAIDTLFDNLVQHFRDEERLLQHIGYPDLAAHVQLHEALTGQAAVLIEDFSGGRGDIGALFTFLARDVVAHHIASKDRDYFPYVRLENGGSEEGEIGA